MPQQDLNTQLATFSAWQQHQTRVLEKLQPWLKQQRLYTTEVRAAIERALRVLGDDSITLAVAGEYARGKTELINALFFSAYGRRLLPADAGRTTMCPTEILYDANCPPRLRLLPIETRLSEVSLAELKADPAAWKVVELDPDDPDDIVQRLQSLTDHKQLPCSEASALGLAADDQDAGDSISVPRWRLAEVNLHHPLLARGLRILDTPGLNAIGSEPELTFEMLPAAHAVIFVLAADTGVTRSDLEIWQRFIQRPGHAERRGVMVVLNKTDTLWDELKTSQQVTETVDRQCRDVSTALGIGDGQVFAVSALKGLQARIREDALLEQRSGIGRVEEFLGRMIMADRRELIRREHNYTMQQALGTLESVIRGRSERNAAQRRTLEALADKSDSAIADALATTQQEKSRYKAHVDAYKKSLADFNGHAEKLASALDIRTLDRTLDAIHDMMTGAWTTYGLKDAMRKLFEDIDARAETATAQTHAMRRVLRSVFRRFENEYGFELPQPTMFSIVRHQVELSLLKQEAEVFRNSARTTLMEQHFVTKRYFRTIVSRTQRIIRQARDDARFWQETALIPLGGEVKAYRESLAKQVADLRQANESNKTIQRRIVALQRDSARLDVQLNSLNKVYRLLADPEPADNSRASGQN